MATNSLHSRIHGLDTLRACAILLVLMYHYMVFVSHEPSFGLLSEIGWMGVDLFFVLSGYLIGNQIFSGFYQHQGFSLKTFYVRRALRTLPNFYVVLAIYLLFPIAAGGKPLTPLWKFLTFTQNFDLKPGTAFSHAWSLSIEEQFYVVLPLLVVACLRWLKSLRAMWCVLLSLMISVLVMRYMMWRQVGDDWTNYYVNIYYSSWCRFDELLPGVALALLKNAHPLWWTKMKEVGNWLVLAGVVLLGVSITLFTKFNYTEGQGFSWFTTCFGYTFLAWSFALLCAAALSPDSYLARLRVPGAKSLALWSYALYLVHKPLMNSLIVPFKSIGISVTSLGGIALMMLSSLVVASLLFTLVETPFMRLRDRYWPLHRNANS